MRILTFAVFIVQLFFFCEANAQSAYSSGSKIAKYYSKTATPLTKSNSSKETLFVNLHLDYDSADHKAAGAGNYERLIWSINNNYTAADSGFTSCIVAFDSLYDVYANKSYVQDSINAMGLDSFYIWLGHENNSGKDDTLIINIIEVDSIHFYPKTSKVFSSIYHIIPAASPLTGNWKAPQRFRYIPWASIPVGRFGIQVTYYGDKSDTLGIVAGFTNKGACNSFPYLADTTQFSRVRMKSSGGKFRANSYIHHSAYPTLELLPTRNGSNIYIDCNGNGQYEPGTDSESPLQNILVDVFVKTNAVGMQEWQSNNLQVNCYPNPTSFGTNLHLNLKNSSAIEISICDISGKKVFESASQVFATGTHTISLTPLLPEGMYFIMVKSDIGNVVLKLIVSGQ